MKPSRYATRMDHGYCSEQGMHSDPFDDDEREFMLAMERYKRERKRPFPTWHEVLMVAKALGYRKEQS